MFIGKYSERYRREVTGISPKAKEKLLTHRWSGNIRELQNCIEKAVILSEGNTLTVNDIQPAPPQAAAESESMIGEDTLEMTEEKAIRAAMNRFGGNLSMVAKALDISRPTLYAKLKKYNI